jgi:hypothetical protein
MHKTLRICVGRVMRDIGRKIKGNDVLGAKCARLLSLASSVHEQQQHQRGLQLPPPHPLAQSFVGPIPRRLHRPASARSSAKPK